MKAYDSLEAAFRRWNGVTGAASMLHWDNATMMPPGAGASRGEQLAALSEVAHEILTAPPMEGWFAQAETEELGEWQQANLREMKRLWQHAAALPVTLVSALTRACHESELRWRAARMDNDFASFAPCLENVLALVRESAAIKASVLGLSPYDALLDQYDPGMRNAIIEPVFAGLAEFLPEFIDEVTERQKTEPPPLPVSQPVSAAAQKALGKVFMERLGFDFARGRLDESVHPFCGGVPGDVRLTARYDENDFLSGFFAVMHETGHALYEMGLPEEWISQPVGAARGMTLHESQSLLTEMQLCISRDFLEFAVPLMRETLRVSGPEWTPDNIYRLMTRVRPSLIRVDADEVTYPAHVILRYRLERRMIEGSLEIRDLPDAWSEQMQSLLGIVPPDDADGCMQDIHWPDGTFGYFPTYTLGAMAAAQFFQAARSAIPALDAQIRQGQFQPLYTWLRENVHSRGSRYSTPELLARATGTSLDAANYRRHLTQRYLET